MMIDHTSLGVKDFDRGVDFYYPFLKAVIGYRGAGQ